MTKTNKQTTPTSSFGKYRDLREEVLSKELAKYRKKSDDQKTIIEQLQNQLAEFNSRIENLESTSTGKLKQQKKKNPPNTKQSEELSFESSNKFNSLIEDGDTDLIRENFSDNDVEMPTDEIANAVKQIDKNCEESFIEVLSKKNKKKREEYPVLRSAPTQPIPKQTTSKEKPKKKMNPEHQAAGEKEAEARKRKAAGENDNEQQRKRAAGENNLNQQKTNSSPPEKKTTPKPPRIILDQDLKDTNQLLSKTLGIQKYSLRKNKNNMTTLKLDTYEDFVRVNETFDETNTMRYTYTPKNEKLQNIVLRGLNKDYTEDEVKVALNSEIQFQEIKDIEIINVKRMTTRKSIVEKFDIPLFVVQISPDSKMTNLLKIYNVDHVIISWEPLRKRLYTQCRRCQRIGHVSANCKMPFRCVKCGNSHNPGECEIKADSDRSLLFCILCRENGHPASYGKCPKILDHLENLEKEKKKAALERQNRIERYNRRINPNVSFANASSQNFSAPQPTPKPLHLDNDINITLKNMQSQMMAMFQSLESKINNISEQVKQNCRAIKNLENFDSYDNCVEYS